MKKILSSMMGIECPTGSHLPVLEKHVAALPADAVVIEHGAGLYSTPLLARYSVRILCSEPHPGWREWARWIYRGNVEMLESYKRAIERLGEASLVFIDGPAHERGVLLQQCLDRGVPVVIAHDTQTGEWSHYQYQPHMFKHPGYVVTQHAEDSHRTTLWVRKLS